jgi:hypothetical protein
MALGLTQHHGNEYQEFSRGTKALPERKADNLTAIPEPIV